MKDPENPEDPEKPEDPEIPESPENSEKCHLTAKKNMLEYGAKSGEGGLLRKANYSIRSINMSFKLLEVGMDALRRVRIGRAALVAAAVCVATARAR